MATTGTLHDAFVDELRDVYDAERQLVKTLPRMIRAVSSEDLRQALENHLEETRGQVERLEDVFAALKQKVRGKHCDGMAGILEEGRAILEEDLDETALDASIIAAAQRVEHYEIAAYGTLVSWAREMGHTEAAGLLEQTLEEEKGADETLSGLAEGGINREAAAGAHGDDEESDQPMAAAAASTSNSTARGKSGAASAPGRSRR